MKFNVNMISPYVEYKPTLAWVSTIFNVEVCMCISIYLNKRICVYMSPPVFTLNMGQTHASRGLYLQ